MTEALVVRAPAKVNLTLEVLARRPDGYHEVRMLMASLSLADELRFEPARRLSLACDRPDLDCGGGNLVLRAAALMQQALGRPLGARIYLKKNIPVGGGLAGGSADAAATLKALNRLWKAGFEPERLRDLAASLGSDIPYCLGGGWAIARGRGELVEPLALRRTLHLALVNPGFEVSTAKVYGGLRRLRVSRGDRSARAARALERRDDEALRVSATNDLEGVTAGLHKEIKVLEKLLMDQGALFSRMSGSGPTVWGVFRNAAEAQNACRFLRKERKLWAKAVRTVEPRRD